MTTAYSVRTPVYLAFAACAAAACFASVAFASSPNDITFPVAELGGCASKNACKAYCAELTHAKACTDFARSHNLITEEEAERNESFALPAEGGPGGCTSHQECRAYCENTAHADECIAFAETHDVMPAEELEEYKRITRALKGGATLPGGCTDKASCQAYCESGDHMAECLAFAEAAGIMSAEELAEAKRIMPLMAAGKMPGGCTSKSSCEAYCADTSHIDECANFAVEAGFMTPEEAEMVKKTGGVGPGGCRGRECEAFCENPANREACVNFALEHGLMSEEDMARMRESAADVEQMLSQTPEEVRTCLKSRIGEEAYQKMQSGELGYLPDVSEHMSACFEAHGGAMETQRAGGMGQMPPEMQRCLTERLGANYEQVEASQFDPAMRACIEEVQAEMQQHYQESGMPPEGQPYPMHTGQPYDGMPPGYTPSEGMPPPEGQPMPYPPPENTLPPEEHYQELMQEAGGTEPPPEAPPQEQPEGEPVSAIWRAGENMLANVLSAVRRLLSW